MQTFYFTIINIIKSLYKFFFNVCLSLFLSFILVDILDHFKIIAYVDEKTFLMKNSFLEWVQPKTKPNVEKLSEDYFLKSIFKKSLDMARGFDMPIQIEVIFQKSNEYPRKISFAESLLVNKSTSTTELDNKNFNQFKAFSGPFNRLSDQSSSQILPKFEKIQTLGKLESYPLTLESYPLAFIETVKLGNVGRLNIFNDFNQFLNAKIGFQKNVNIQNWTLSTNAYKKQVFQTNSSNDLEIFSYHVAELAVSSPNLRFNQNPTINQDKVIVAYKIQNLVGENNRSNSQYLQIRYLISSNSGAKFALSYLPRERLIGLELAGDISEFWKKKPPIKPYGSMTQSIFGNQTQLEAISEKTKERLKKAKKDQEKQKETIAMLKKKAKINKTKNNALLEEAQENFNKRQLEISTLTACIENAELDKPYEKILLSSTNSLEDKQDALKKIRENRANMLAKHEDKTGVILKKNPFFKKYAYCLMIIAGTLAGVGLFKLIASEIPIRNAPVPNTRREFSNGSNLLIAAGVIMVPSVGLLIADETSGWMIQVMETGHAIAQIKKRWFVWLGIALLIFFYFRGPRSDGESNDGGNSKVNPKPSSSPPALTSPSLIAESKNK